MLVNIQSFITHTMFFSSYSSLHSINWMKANDTRTQEQQNINCVVIWPMVCVYARKFCALNHPYFCAYDIGIFRLLLKIPRNFKRRSNFFHITWCLHSHKKETECLPHSGKSMKNKSLPHCLQLDFSLFFFSCFSVGVVSCWLFVLLFLRCCCLFVSVCCVWQKCQSLFDWSNLHTVQRIYTHGSIRAISFIKMLWISFLSSWNFDSLILTFPLFPFT